MVQEINAIVTEHHMPMVENLPLDRTLTREVHVGALIAARWFKPVTEILSAVYRLRRGWRR